MTESSVSAKSLLRSIEGRLKEILPDQEVSPHAYWILEALFNVSRMAVMVDKPLKLTPAGQERLEEVIMRLRKQEPIQYILEEASFFGRMFQVSPAVLIPRPETEELVQLILNRRVNNRGLKILDIGTGSGCIAISLALELPGAKVTAVDVSEEALRIARLNAKSLGAAVKFVNADILRDQPDLPHPDIIVSNPPYIRAVEAGKMAGNVLEWEPHLALFVEDHDPLLFYRKIAALAVNILKAGGYLYFEINEAFGAEVVRLLEDQGFSSVALHKDMQGKDRMVSACRRKEYNNQTGQSGNL